MEQMMESLLAEMRTNQVKISLVKDRGRDKEQPERN
jgi:hypothetical protein